MAMVRIGRDESFESGLKRFKRKVENEKIIKEIKKHTEYKKPSVKRKEKEVEAEQVRKRAEAKAKAKAQRKKFQNKKKNNNKK